MASERQPTSATFANFYRQQKATCANTSSLSDAVTARVVPGACTVALILRGVRYSATFILHTVLMSGFDEARSGRGGGGGGGGGGGRRNAPSARPAAGGGGGAFDAAAGVGLSSTGQYVASLGAGSYQGGDSTYDILKESIERDLRKLTTLIAATRKLSEQLGSKQDSAEMRKRM